MSQHPPPPYPHPEDVAAATATAEQQRQTTAKELIAAAASQHQPQQQQQQQEQSSDVVIATAASQHRLQSQDTVNTGATAAAEALQQQSIDAVTEDSPLILQEKLKASLQEQIDKIRVTREKIYAAFEALKNSPTPTAVSITEFGSSVDTANLELQTAKAALAQYKKKTNVNDTSLAGGSSSSKSKSKKKRKSYKSYHPEIGKTRKHHSHDDHKRVSFVHQA